MSRTVLFIPISTSSLYVYAFSPPTCESQYVVGSVKNSPCLQRLRIASSLTLMPRPGPVENGDVTLNHEVPFVA